MTAEEKRLVKELRDEIQALRKEIQRLGGNHYHYHYPTVIPDTQPYLPLPPIYS